MSLAQLIMHKMCLTWPKLSFLPTIFEFLQWPSLSGVNHQMLHHYNGWMTLTRWMTSCHHPRVVILVSSSPASTLRWLSSRNDRQKKTSVVVGPRGSSQPTVSNDSCPFGLRTNDPLVAGQKRPTTTNVFCVYHFGYWNGYETPYWWNKIHVTRASQRFGGIVQPGPQPAKRRPIGCRRNIQAQFSKPRTSLLRKLCSFIYTISISFKSF